MKAVPLSRLEALIVRPGIEEHLKPLMRYKGNQSLGRLHRMWNLMLSAMEHEATSADITQRLALNPACAQLCCPDKTVTSQAIRSFCGRLIGSPSVMDEAPGLAEYIDWLLPPHKKAFTLDRLSDPPTDFADRVLRRPVSWAAREFEVSREVAERWYRELGLVSPRNLKRRPDDFSAKCTGKSLKWASDKYEVSYEVANRWFRECGVTPKRAEPVRRAELSYPFLIHDRGTDEHRLLRKVSAAVPLYLDAALRADMCQDLVVGILAGELSEDDLHLPSRELISRVFKMSAGHYGDRSLDAVIGDGNFTLMDTLVEEGRDWA